MQQRINGKRLQNWHRPLQPDEYSQRYIRLRHAVLPEDIDEVVDALHNEDCACTDCGPSYSWHDLADLQSLIVHEIEYFISEKEVFCLGDAFPDALKALQLPETEERGQCDRAQIQKTDEQILETIRSIVDGLEEKEALCLGQMPSFVASFLDGEGNIQLCKQVLRKIGQENILLLSELVLLNSLWVRPLTTWKMPADKHDIPRSLIDHLLLAFPVPEFLLNQVLNASLHIVMTHLQLCICWGQGISLKKAAAVLNWKVWNGFQHHISLAPATLRLLDACLFAKIHQLGLVNIEPAILIDASWFDFGLLQSENNYAARIKMQEDMLRWLDLHWHDLDLDLLQLYTDFFYHIFNNLDDYPGFKIKGRSLKKIQEVAWEYQNAGYRELSVATWNPKGWEASYLDLEGKEWQFQEICTGIGLLKEGISMSHCVGGYVEACKTGSSSIFSLMEEGKSRITIEVQPKDLTIVQARGKCNREAKREEKELIAKWKNEVLVPSFSNAQKRRKSA